MSAFTNKLSKFALACWIHGVNVDGFKYKNTYGENHQIQVNIKATMIAGKTLFTHLYGGRGEKRYEHLNF